MEREHQKEKQKLLKDKDAGAFMPAFHPHSHLDTYCSEEPTNEGESDKDKDGEPGTGITEGVSCPTHGLNDMDQDSA